MGECAGQLTYEDLLGLPGDGKRHEILAGRHYVTEPPPLAHQGVVVELISWMAPAVRRHRLGRLFIAPVDVLLGEHDVVQPDLLFVVRARSGILTEENLRGAPDLVGEVSSPATAERDAGIKLQRYELFGVGEYWIVDREREAAVIYRRAGEGLVLAAQLTAAAGEMLTSPLLPGLAIPLSEVFEPES